MTVEEEIRGETVVLRLAGNPMTGPEVAPFHESVRRVVQDGARKVVVDLADVNHMGSVMLGALAAGLATVRAAGGSIDLACASPRVADLLELTRLDTVFRQYESVAQALGTGPDDGTG